MPHLIMAPQPPVSSCGGHTPSPTHPPTHPTARCRTHGQAVVVKEATEERVVASKFSV